MFILWRYLLSVFGSSLCTEIIAKTRAGCRQFSNLTQQNCICYFLWTVQGYPAISIRHLHCVMHLFVEIKANCSKSSAVAIVCLSPILNSFFFFFIRLSKHIRSVLKTFFESSRNHRILRKRYSMKTVWITQITSKNRF